MNEDTKLILEEMAKMHSELMQEIQNLRTETNEGFKDVYAAVQTCYNSTTQQINDVEERLTSKIDDLQRVTGQNCYELTLLKTKQA